MTNNSLELTLSPRDEIARESEKRLTWEIVLETFTLLCVILVALVGNSLTCAAVYRNQRLRTAPNYYVVTLAISDILMAILLATFGVAVIIEGRWLFGSVACEVLGFLPILLATFSIYIMMLIAVNRYFTVLHRAIHKKYFTLRNTVFVDTCCMVVIVELPVVLQSCWKPIRVPYWQADMCFLTRGA